MLIQTPSPKEIMYDRKLRAIAANFRLHETPAEAILWEQLKGKKIGYKFRRQHTLHGFIVDFYCYELMLVVEIDGSVHDQQKNKDQLRDLTLQKQGYKTIRFCNEDILFNLQMALNKIKNYPLFPG